MLSSSALCDSAHSGGFHACMRREDLMHHAAACGQWRGIAVLACTTTCMARGFWRLRFWWLR